MTANKLIICLFFFAATQSIGNTQSQSESDAPHTQFAMRVESMLASATQTTYQHTTDIDEQRGVLRCDCSGLIGFVLRHHFPEHYISVKGDEADWRKRPLAVTYFETFVAAGKTGVSSGSWNQVSSLSDVVPGDILAWRKKKLKSGSTTGHVCMIASMPEKQSDGSVRVRLIDSTRSPHADDTRPKGKTGVGAGFKTFIVHQQGEPIGYFVGERRVLVGIAVGRMVHPVAVSTNASDHPFVGLEKIKAIELAESKQQAWRIIREDQKPAALPWKIREERVNFVIEDGKVVRVARG